MTKRGKPGTYHREVLGGGNTLKAVTRTRRAAASHSLGGPWLHRRQMAKAAARVMQLAERYDA